ncbi:ATP-binding protein [Streptomyces sp. NPDC058691]|uniref:ATP-binding protein n=1 Tax=Streptomyces sp. NPDC058691 TaxID=3346601 RepID=UPI00365516E9
MRDNPAGRTSLLSLVPACGPDPAAGTPPPDRPDRPDTRTRRAGPSGAPRASALLGEVFLPSDDLAAAHARRILSAALDSWGLGHLLETAEAVLSELVANAVRHAGGRHLGITLWRRLSLVHLSVRDGSRALPCPRLTGPPPTCPRNGSGLQAVSSLSFRWGTELLPAGKRVWAEIAV